MPPAQSWTLQKFHFLGDDWSIILYDNGFGETSSDSISIMVIKNAVRHSDSGADMSIGILVKSHERAVFYKKHTLGDDNLWFKSFRVDKKELETSPCLNNDSFTMACTLAFLDMKQQYQQEEKKITKMLEEMVMSPRTAKV